VPLFLPAAALALLLALPTPARAAPLPSPARAAPARAVPFPTPARATPFPASTRAASLSFRIPRLDGEFTGVAGLLRPDPARDTHEVELRWKITASTPAATPATAARLPAGPSAGLRIITLDAEGSGIALRARAEVDAATLDGTWRMESAHAELAEFLPRLAARLPALISGLTAEGRVEITGDGEFRAGKFDGRATLRFDNATLSDPAAGWTIEGLALHASLASLATLSTAGGTGTADTATAAGTGAPQTLSFTRLEIAGVEIRDARATFALMPGGLLRLDSFRADMLGGSLALAPFTFDPARPVLIRAKVAGIDTALLAARLPAAVSEASGRLSGDLEFRWDPRAGLTFGDGHLSLQKTAPATLRLAPAPGFLTSKVPAKIAPLGGPFRRLLVLKNPAHDTLSKIELGEMPLIVESIEAGFEPAGDGQGRTARAVIVTRPAVAGGPVKTVRFNINTFGPLAEAIHIGMNDTLSFTW
jgi:hypothetical protein